MMDTANDMELNELQGVYEAMDADGKQKMLSMAESLLHAQSLFMNERANDTSISYCWDKKLELSGF